MGRPPKITGALREELWRRYKAGETILGIGRALDQRQATIHRVLQTNGASPLPAGAVPQEYLVSASVKRFREVSPQVVHSAPSPEACTEPFPR